MSESQIQQWDNVLHGQWERQPDRYKNIDISSQYWTFMLKYSAKYNVILGEMTKIKYICYKFK